jgi:hypothetical protein
VIALLYERSSAVIGSFNSDNEPLALVGDGLQLFVRFKTIVNDSRRVSRSFPPAFVELIHRINRIFQTSESCSMGTSCKNSALLRLRSSVANSRPVDSRFNRKEAKRQRAELCVVRFCKCLMGPFNLWVSKVCLLMSLTSLLPKTFVPVTYRVIPLHECA